MWTSVCAKKAAGSSGLRRKVNVSLRAAASRAWRSSSWGLGEGGGEGEPLVRAARLSRAHRRVRVSAMISHIAY